MTVEEKFAAIDDEQATAALRRRIEELTAERNGLANSHPKCANCGKPAACMGSYENDESWAYACDDCCAHGCEDGRCYPLEEIPQRYQKRGQQAERERDTALARVKELEARIDNEFTHDQLLHEVSSYRSGMMAAETALASARTIAEEPIVFNQRHMERRIKRIREALASHPAPAPVAAPCAGCAAARELILKVEHCLTYDEDGECQHVLADAIDWLKEHPAK